MNIEEANPPVEKMRKMRSTSIELLRVLCMVVIIAHHCVFHGGGLNLSSGANNIFAYFLLPGGKIAFVCFVAISMWFFVDQKFKAERFLKVWFEVLFYTFLLAVASWAFGVDMTIGDWVGSLLPVGGISHGFAATYLVFYLFLPFLNRLTQGVTKKQVNWLIAVLLYVQVLPVIFEVFGITNLALHPFPSEIQLFIFCYFVLLYLKRWPLKICENKFAMLVVFASVWVLAFVFLLAISHGIGGATLGMLQVLFSNENSLLYLVGGIALFFVFKNINMPFIPAINAIAATTFGILLIHDHNIFRPVLWNQILDMPNLWVSNYAPLYVLAVTAGIFILGFIVDLLRKRYLETPLFQLKAIKRLGGAIEKVFIEEKPDTHERI